MCVASILRIAVIPLVLSEEVAPSDWVILSEVSEANLRASGTGCPLWQPPYTLGFKDPKDRA
jgi:hypothetical protein